LVGVAFVGAGCVPKPRPGSMDVAGDSLTIQAFYNGGFGAQAPADLVVIANNGWTVADAQPHVTEAVKHGRPEVLIVALATNDSNPLTGGWTDDDVTRFRRLINTPHPDACVVVVTPGYGPALGDAYKNEIHEARLALRALIAERARTVEADWYVVTRDHPEYISPDGLHLQGAPAWQARSTLYWQAAANCPPRSPPGAASAGSRVTGPRGRSSAG
jgi:hypothetical protein